MLWRPFDIHLKNFKDILIYILKYKWNFVVTQILSQHKPSCILSQHEGRHPCTVERQVGASPFSILLDTSLFENLRIIHVPCWSEVKIAFIIAHTRNNAVVLFGTLKVQSFMLTEVRNCDFLIVVTSSTFLKRKDYVKRKKQLAQIIKTRSTAYI